MFIGNKPLDTEAVNRTGCAAFAVYPVSKVV